MQLVGVASKRILWYFCGTKILPWNIKSSVLLSRSSICEICWLVDSWNCLFRKKRPLCSNPQMNRKRVFEGSMLVPLLLIMLRSDWQYFISFLQALAWWTKWGFFDSLFIVRSRSFFLRKVCYWIWLLPR